MVLLDSSGQNKISSLTSISRMDAVQKVWPVFSVSSLMVGGQWRSLCKCDLRGLAAYHLGYKKKQSNARPWSWIRSSGGAGRSWTKITTWSSSLSGGFKRGGMVQTQSELHSKTPLPGVTARKSCRLTS